MTDIYLKHRVFTFHLLCGLLRPLIYCGCSSNVILGTRSGVILLRWPYKARWNFSMFFFLIGSTCWKFSLTFTFRILSRREIPRIVRKNHISVARIWHFSGNKCSGFAAIRLDRSNNCFRYLFFANIPKLTPVTSSSAKKGFSVADNVINCQRSSLNFWLIINHSWHLWVYQLAFKLKMIFFCLKIS